jgi:hypothetical protein
MHIMNFSFSNVNSMVKEEISQEHTLTLLFDAKQENKKEKGKKDYQHMTRHPIKNCKDRKQSVPYTQ